MAGNPPEEGIGLLSGPPAAASSPAKGHAATAAPEIVAPAPVPVVKAAPVGLLSLKAADDLERFVTAGTVTTLSAVLTSAHHEPGLATIAVEVAYASTYPGEGA